MKEKYDIDANVEKLLDIDWGEQDSGSELEWIERVVLKNSQLIHEISEACRETEIFKRNIDTYTDFKKNFKDKDHKIANAYYWFLDRLVKSPTHFHRLGSVRLCLPIVDDFIQEYFHSLEDK